jgi:hypothetical protein
VKAWTYVPTVKQINKEGGHICWDGVQQRRVLEKNEKEIQIAD